MNSSRIAVAIITLCVVTTSSLCASPFDMEASQITFGPHHHFFGYIGQCLTTPWNAGETQILTLRTTFHDRMPRPDEAAEIVLLDVKDNYRPVAVDKTRAWNFQQGTMFYWHPKHPESQFFFNDRDPDSNRVYTVLYDTSRGQRLREFRSASVPVANGGVSPTGDFFLAINYGRMARLRPVTGYPGAADPTMNHAAPENDGIFRVDVESGEQTLLASFRRLRRTIMRDEDVEAKLYINHTLCSRDGSHVYFFLRGRRGQKSMAVNVPCSMRTDGTELRSHAYVGGHPEWDEQTVVIGSQDDRQVLYDIQQAKIIGQLASPDVIPSPGGDIALSQDGNWFVCGYAYPDRASNRYTVVRRSDGEHAHSRVFSRGPYQRGELRIDPAPRWNRSQNRLLVPAFTTDGTRQLHLIRISSATQ